MSSSQNILLIRHRQAGARSLEILQKHSHCAILLPFSEIREFKTSFPIGNFQAIIVTSPVAARMIAANSEFENLSLLPVYCVGDISASIMHKAGFTNIAHIAPDAMSLAKAIGKFGSDIDMLYPCAKNRSFDFGAYLLKHGIRCCDWLIYENRLITPKPAEIYAAMLKTDVVFLYSKRTCQHFFQTLDKENAEIDLKFHKFVAISRDVTEFIPRKFQQNTYVAIEKNEESMIECLIE